MEQQENIKPGGLGQVRPPKLSDAVAQHLEILILRGVLQPGERLLSERELAEKLDVSRPSLREALQKLQERGLIVAAPGGGAQVAELLSPTFTEPLTTMMQSHPETALDYLEFRCAVEGSAAHLAALRRTEADCRNISGYFDKMVAAHGKEDPTEEADADADFHLAIYEATHNIVLLHLMRGFSLMLRNDVFYNRARLYQRKGVRSLLRDQHKAIHDAVIAGDPEAARTAAERHITFTLETVRELSQDDLRLQVALQRLGRDDLLAAPSGRTRPSSPARR